MTLRYKNLSPLDIEKRCLTHKINPDEYQFFINKLITMGFNLDHAHLILFKKGYKECIQKIEGNFQAIFYQWGYSYEQVARIAGIGGSEVLNEVMLFSTPLLTYGYSTDDIHKIAVHANAVEKLKYLMEKHYYLLSIGLNIKDISILLVHHQTTQSITDRLSTGMSFSSESSSSEPPQRSPSRQELSRLVDTPSPYSHAVFDEYSDRPTPYSHALDDEYMNRPSPYCHEVFHYTSELSSPSEINLFDTHRELPSLYSHELSDRLEQFSAPWEDEISFRP